MVCNVRCCTKKQRAERESNVNRNSRLELVGEAVQLGKKTGLGCFMGKWPRKEVLESL